MRGRYHVPAPLLRSPSVTVAGPGGRPGVRESSGDGVVARLGLGLLLTVGCPSDDDGPERSAEAGADGSMTPTSGPSDEGTSSGGVEVPTRDAADQCELAPVVGAGTHYGSLRGNGSELRGACGRGGPDAFVRLEVPRRSDVSIRALGAGFSPRVGVLPHECIDEWETRTMLCDEGVGAWLLDVAAGSSLVVSVGIDPEHPVLDQPPPMLGPDPLSFALEVELRNVLDEGDPCGAPDRGRCGAGTACLPPPPDGDPSTPQGPDVCTVVEGDTCDTALDVVVPAGTSSIWIEPDAGHTDAHHHQCGGARRSERVLRLAMPGAGPHGLEVRGDRPGLVLALRGPGCLPSDELGCAADDLAPAVLTAEIPGPSALLFVELPLDDADEEDGTTTGGEPGEEAPIELLLEVLEAPVGE